MRLFTRPLAGLLLAVIGVTCVWTPVLRPEIATRWFAHAHLAVFGLIGALFILPIILMYTCWSYYVFRGKVRIGDGYH